MGFVFRISACACLLIARVSSDSCTGRCGNSFEASKTCQCNFHCVQYGDCCADYSYLCTTDSCSGRCNAALDLSKECQCNSVCTTFGDCCPDYQTLCVDGTGGGDGGDGGHQTTCDISCLAEQLWQNDVNRIQVWDYEVNIQEQTTTSSSSDSAPRSLFTYVHDDVVFQKPTFKTFRALLDNYTPSTAQAESLTVAQWQEIDAFLDAILDTQIMTLLFNFLQTQGKVTDTASFRETLKELWFNLYARSSSGPINSSGFEHVLVGETTTSKVSGFHSWVQFYLEEKKGALNYQGWVSRHQSLNIIAARFTWNGLPKAKGSFFLGSSPEFDMAIYSACAIMEPNSGCSVTMAGNTISIQTYDVASKSGLQVATAYPNV